ncbi:GNAT family N-acetyltransferase [Vibrio atypicus]|uniref:GNAT family N-acetyltransferase n=1 Tax=Vibrio atypicus TaxID=558271 RepID=UPI001357A49B|nr:GNAT family N-acetyltransferase [Vibrio atypicus]
MEQISTERLVLRLATVDDANFVLELYNTPDFLQFVGDKQIHDVNDAKIYIEQKILGMRASKGVCLLVIESKADSKPLGVCGLIKRDELTAYDIGYGLLPKAYGFGYAIEAAKGVISYAKAKEGIDELVAITTSDNFASQKLLNTLGFNYIKVQSKISDTIDLLLYQLKLTDNETHSY